MKKFIDFKLLKLLAIFYTATSFVSLFKIYYLKTRGFGYEYSTWKSILLESILLDWLTIILIMSTIAITTKIMIIKKVRWSFIIFIHLFFSLFIGFIIYFFSSIAYLLSGQIALSEINFEDYMPGIISVVDLNFLIYFSMISIVYSFYYFKQIQKTELEKSQLSNQLTNAKLNILKYKLHPHFLFNTLNSISSLIETDSKLAQNTVADFGDLLRDLLNLNDKSLIPLSEEINISKRYLDIMALRFSDDLKISINVEKGIENVQVPSLILLPIIENSIKHGYSYDITSLKVDLTIFKKDKKITFKISNNGAPLNLKSKKYGNGVQNTIDRLNILYNKNYIYSMENTKNNNGVITTIIIPAE